jgi:hypothetical protein
MPRHLRLKTVIYRRNEKGDLKKMSSETIVILLGTLLFFGFAAWMAFYSRAKDTDGEEPKASHSSDERSAPLSNET